ncbi:MAG: SDR family oxidoreductase [Oligoflexia bacterium]|nr:SDR family oxidoreductase [Oligoflexia bacterium]
MNNYLSSLFNLSGKVALVTGATGQLGYAICESFLASGMNVIGIDLRISQSRVIQSENIQYFEVDIRNADALKDFFNKLSSSIISIDVLVNNAGVSVFEPFEERPEESFDWVMDVNLKGTFFCIQNYVNFQRINRKHGSIVNVASFYGVISPDFRIYTDCSRKNSEVYGATKAGIIQMSKYFAVHLANDNIKVNCISPGGIFNPENPQGEDFLQNYSFRCPMKRMAKVQEMIGAILYLSSDAASYTTGQNIIIDGGMSCW